MMWNQIEIAANLEGRADHGSLSDFIPLFLGEIEEREVPFHLRSASMTVFSI
jgi:hypothetical protein